MIAALTREEANCPLIYSLLDRHLHQQINHVYTAHFLLLQIASCPFTKPS
jgi:hypothetical protein